MSPLEPEPGELEALREELNHFIRLSQIQTEQLMAYQKLYLWYAGATGSALSEKIRTVLAPISPKKIEEVADHLDKWLTELRRLEQHGGDYVL